MTKTCPYAHLDLIDAPIFVLEVCDGVPVYAAVNASALTMAGRSAQHYIGRSALEIYPQAYGRTAYAHHCTVAQSGKPLTYEIDLPLGTGLRTFQTTLQPELDASGRVLRMFGSCRDLHAEQHALAAKHEFHTLSSEMEQFVALAAHDLRAPLRNIAALTNLMRDKTAGTDGETLELIDLIEGITAQSMDLISDVLSHAETTASVQKVTNFSFPALCHGIWETLDPTGAHGLTTSLSNLSADRTALRVALRNIAENAVKHGSRDHLDVDISVQPGLPGMLDITVTDNGKGFSDAALAVMNGGRFKVDSGYGLFAIKRLISARGGTLVARNLPDGGGAVVRFSLPGSILGADTQDIIARYRPPPEQPSGPREIRLQS